MAEGHGRADAYRQARLALGGPEQVKEGARDRLVTLEERTDQATEYGTVWAFAYPDFTWSGPVDLSSRSDRTARR